MNTDFIKWMCERAEGFELYDFRTIDTPYGEVDIHYQIFDTIIYPLLLQRAIEGVNDTWDINIVKRVGGWQWDEELIKPWGTCDDIFFDNPDNAKESALLYIYEQERS